MSERVSLIHPHRFEVTAELEVMSPLHLGTGERERDLIPRLSSKAGEENNPELALIARDGSGKPYLPGPSLKGLLRRLAADGGAVTALFGDPNSAETGVMGSVLVWGAPCKTMAPPSDAPYAADLAGKDRPGTFVSARTKIDPKSGTAEHNKLFFQEVVPPGTLFSLKLLVIGRAEEEAKAALDRLLPPLARLAAGAHIGKGQADGQGRVRLKTETLTVTRRWVDNNGELSSAPHPITLPPAPAAARGWNLRLTCEGPFLVQDSSHIPPGEGREALKVADKLERNDPALSNLKGQRLAKKLPLLPGTSLMGAIRARAEWLAALEGWNEGRKKDAIELLFGKVGHRGRLRLDEMRTEDAQPWNVTSVKLDRFSGAPVDGALFTSAAFCGVRITANLVLDPCRDTTAAAFAADAFDLAGKIIEDLKKNGLMLGHGTNKGFGWFDVAVETIEKVGSGA
ncbi:MAG: hypothetical protein RLY86_2369 [Pseudomonadota bacterium]|jgi:CRISPR/Cas system CSM-associated protein Csm3 (group 7 of RAMP superfamily)